MVILCCHMENFGEWLRGELNTRGMSQKEFADRSGVTPAQISRVISGTRGIGEESILAIARALRLPPEQVFRAAGLLPPVPEPVEEAEELLSAFSKLTQEDRDEVLRIVKMKLEYKKGGSPPLKPPRRKAEVEIIRGNSDFLLKKD